MKIRRGHLERCEAYGCRKDAVLGVLDTWYCEDHFDDRLDRLKALFDAVFRIRRKEPGIQDVKEDLSVALSHVRRVKPVTPSSVDAGGSPVYMCRHDLTSGVPCGKIFATPQGRGLHELRVHGRVTKSV